MIAKSLLLCLSFPLVALGFLQSVSTTTAAVRPSSSPSLVVREAMAWDNNDKVPTRTRQPSKPLYKTAPGELVLSPRYNIPSSVLAAAPLVLALHSYVQTGSLTSFDSLPLWVWAGAAVHGILGTYIYKQTHRVRCVFDRNTGTFEFKNLKKNVIRTSDGPEPDHPYSLVEKPNKNYVRGTRNQWKCKDVIDFGYVPAKEFPLICYFIETGTDNREWGEYGLWGQIWSSTYADRQPVMHFFPGFIDVPRFEEELLARGGRKQQYVQASTSKKGKP